MRTPAGIRRSGQVAWTLAIAIAGAYGIYLHVPQATQPEPPIRHPGRPLEIKSVIDGAVDTLFAAGASWTIAVISARCAICRRDAHSIGQLLRSSQADRTLWLSIDEPEVGRTYHRYMASDDTLWVLNDPTDLRRIAVRHVPLLVNLDPTGALIGVRLGAREAPDQVGW